MVVTGKKKKKKMKRFSYLEAWPLPAGEGERGGSGGQQQWWSRTDTNDDQDEYDDSDQTTRHEMRQEWMG